MRNRRSSPEKRLHLRVRPKAGQADVLAGVLRPGTRHRRSTRRSTAPTLRSASATSKRALIDTGRVGASPAHDARLGESLLPAQVTAAASAPSGPACPTASRAQPRCSAAPGRASSAGPCLPIRQPSCARLPPPRAPAPTCDVLQPHRATGRSSVARPTALTSIRHHKSINDDGHTGPFISPA